MPGDYSRKTFNRTKHYSGVLMQQGRVQLDADWNEQLDIQLYRTETEALDVIGQSGAPQKGGGFDIGTTAGGRDLTISAGRIYVEGLLCEAEQQSTYTSQPYFPNPDFTTPSSPPAGARQLSLDSGIYLVFLDAWQRELTALDDTLMREVALGGPDSTTRLQNVWQVRLLRVGAGPSGSPPSALPACGTDFPEFDEYTAPSTGTLNARTQPPRGEENVCLLPPSAGYGRLENQLYRVEVHTGGTRDQATFKWSRDNASVETKVKTVKDNVITVSDLGKDEVLNFAGDQWVEIVDAESTLKGTPHALVQIDKVDPGTGEITMKTSVASFEGMAGLKLRRWDQKGVSAQADGVNANLAVWIEMEGGIQVRFAAGQYRPGDYWLIPARTTTGEIEWPPYEIPNTNPIPQPPRGVRHHYCRLALVEVAGGVVSIIDDCRKVFPPLTELTHFFYVGGTGQEAMPGQLLPCPLQVGVKNGQRPVPRARVRFEVVNAAAGTLHSGANSGAELTVETNAAGVAQCEWELGAVGADRGRACLQVEASLISSAGRPLRPPVRFNANLSLASQVAYTAPEDCVELQEARTVQAAIDELCKQKPQVEPGIKITGITTRADREPLLNDRLVPVARLARGVIITCDGPIAEVSAGRSPDPPPTSFHDAIAGKPTCFVTLDLPYPLGQDRNFWDMNQIVAFQPVIVAGNVAVRESQMFWAPTDASNRWLQEILFERLRREITDRVLAHLTLKGNFIFSPDSRLYLDGEAFGRVDDAGRVGVGFPTGDERRGGDFEMWFWLVPSLPAQPTGPVLTVATPVAVGTPVRGFVRDATGAALPNLQITLTATQTGVARTALTNTQGEFSFAGIGRGTYRVSVSVGGVTIEQPVTVG